MIKYLPAGLTVSAIADCEETRSIYLADSIIIELSVHCWQAFHAVFINIHQRPV